MAWVSANLVLVLAGVCALLVGSLVEVRRRRRRRQVKAAVRRSGPMIPRRSQVIEVSATASSRADAKGEELSPQRASSTRPPRPAQPRPEIPAVGSARPGVHEAKTREFSAHMEELAALSMGDAFTEGAAVHDARTREFAAAPEAWLAAQEARRSLGARASSETARPPAEVPTRVRAAPGRCDEDATLKVRRPDESQPGARTAQELREMLGASPTPDLANIEIYYLLALAYLAEGNDVEARQSFLVVDGISPGYRDTAEQLARLPSHTPTVSGPNPVHEVMSSSGVLPAHGKRAVEGLPARARRSGR